MRLQVVLSRRPNGSRLPAQRGRFWRLKSAAAAFLIACVAIGLLLAVIVLGSLIAALVLILIATALAVALVRVAIHRARQ